MIPRPRAALGRGWQRAATTTTTAASLATHCSSYRTAAKQAAAVSTDQGLPPCPALPGRVPTDNPRRRCSALSLCRVIRWIVSLVGRDAVAFGGQQRDAFGRLFADTVVRGTSYTVTSRPNRAVVELRGIVFE